MEHVSEFMVQVRNAYRMDLKANSRANGLVCPEETRTVQDGKDDADINVIVRRFGITGQLPTNVRMPQYGDFQDAVDFHTAMNAIIAANDSFSQMPATVRDRFQNDPARFVDFCLDERNREEAQRLGLVRMPLPAPESAPAASVPASPATPS